MRVYHFNGFGHYLGYVDDEGRYFDARGRLIGTFRGAELRDARGVIRGRVDAQGSFYEAADGAQGYFRDWPRMRERLDIRTRSLRGSIPDTDGRRERSRRKVRPTGPRGAAETRPGAVSPAHRRNDATPPPRGRDGGSL
jgi:hypothetical protein